MQYENELRICFDEFIQLKILIESLFYEALRGSELYSQNGE